MNTVLIILACFAGIFAFAFGLAGLVGMLDFDPPKGKEAGVRLLFDQVFTGGLGTIVHAVAQNWGSRGTERRLLYIGIVWGVVCGVLVLLVD